ncbi:MAG: hypothetical protein M2R45_02610 [Verrucomicrobia subdivision 3 bacterium]|nr:hypothetical protein [Limisphaerales bacterium]MCS1416422.1 hypothetical protein [Limisphaerales bacterium]
MGRGTTLVEVALLGRAPFGCAINTLSQCLMDPRLDIPILDSVAECLKALTLAQETLCPEDLPTFYHPGTLREICNLRQYCIEREAKGQLDPVDQWIRMVALNRLIGYSPGFFLVYSLLSNQVVSVQSQRKITEKRQQVLPRRFVLDLILKKSKCLLGSGEAAFCDGVRAVGDRAIILTQLAHVALEISDGSVALVVTSPPFLDVVDYAMDNWLRCWFLGIDAREVTVTVPHRLDRWEAAMTEVFRELYRVLRPCGFVAFEVGEVRRGEIELETSVLRCGYGAGLAPGVVMFNDQAFTKTSNCWGIDNNVKGTNTNRNVVSNKPE